MVIYLFSDEEGFPIYVGKSKNFKSRVYQHLQRDRFRYNSYFYNWLNKQIAEDKEFYIDILEEASEDNWQDREKYWIQHYRDNGIELKNMTDGGDGNNNQMFTEETRHKMALSQTGRKHSEESRRKMSESMKGRVFSEATRKKLSDINKGKIYPEETKLKTSKAVIKYTLEGIIVEEFVSLTKASESIQSRKSSLQNAMKKKNRQFKGFVWEYKK